MLFAEAMLFTQFSVWMRRFPPANFEPKRYGAPSQTAPPVVDVGMKVFAAGF
jgi:hypothetical protein